MAESTTVGSDALPSSRLMDAGVDIDSLDARTIGQIISVNNAIDAIREERAALEREARSRKCTISEIAERSGVSRATIYNKEQLRVFIEYHITCDKSEMDLLRDENARLLSTIDKLKLRDGEVLLVRMENDQLKERVAALERALGQSSAKQPTVKVISGRGRKPERNA